MSRNVSPGYYGHSRYTRLGEHVRIIILFMSTETGARDRNKRNKGVYILDATCYAKEARKSRRDLPVFHMPFSMTYAGDLRSQLNSLVA